MRFHGNLGEPDVSTSIIPGWSSRVNKLQARFIECTRWSRERNQGRVLQRVSRIEGNEEKRDGCQASQRLDITDEAGERTT